MATGDELKGRAERAAGELTDNERLKREGSVDKAAGKTQATYGDVKEDVKDAVKKP